MGRKDHDHLGASRGTEAMMGLAGRKLRSFFRNVLKDTSRSTLVLPL
jgi:hypothetical protein